MGALSIPAMLRQYLDTAAIVGLYHGVSAIGNMIDRDGGVIEHRCSQLAGRALLDNFHLPVTVEGLEHIQGLEHYSVVSTHASYLDWAVLLGYFPEPLRFIAKRELARLPGFGYYLRNRGIFVDRSKGHTAKDAIRQAARERLPWPILIFAEGTRSPDGTIRPFRKGGLSIIAEEGLALLPVNISGTFKACPRGARHINTHVPITFSIGEPVTARDGDVTRQVELVEERVRELRRRAES